LILLVMRGGLGCGGFSGMGGHRWRLIACGDLSALWRTPMGIDRLGRSFRSVENADGD
jgi:hypothetical protein